jgi:hypothetical protein
MVAEEGTINYAGKCHSIKFTMGNSFLDKLRIVIPMGNVDVVFAVQ